MHAFPSGTTAVNEWAASTVGGDQHSLSLGCHPQKVCKHWGWSWDTAWNWHSEKVSSMPSKICHQYILLPSHHTLLMIDKLPDPEILTCACKGDFCYVCSTGFTHWQVFYKKSRKKWHLHAGRILAWLTGQGRHWTTYLSILPAHGHSPKLGP